MNSPIHAVSVLLTTHTGEEVYLARRDPDSEVLADHWETPGGKVEPGETLIEATLREIQEECGLMLDPNQLQYAGSIQCRGTGGMNADLDLFIYRLPKGVHPSRCEPEKRTEWFRWSIREAMNRYPISPATASLIHVHATNLK